VLRVPRHAHYDPSVTDAREFHDGREDGLVALESLDLDKATSFSSLLRAMSKTAFSGRSLGEALDVTLAMVRDPDCKVVLTLSGAMTIAKMGKVISKMIDTGMVQAVVSTGALMAHGMSEAVGLTHYRHDPTVSDEELFDKGYNRVYDTLEMEANLNYVEEFSSRMGKTITQVPRRTMEALQRHPWPGNVRELRNVIEHGAILTTGETLRVPLLEDEGPVSAAAPTLADSERELILRALEATRWRIKGSKGAAAALGLHPSTLYSRMKKLGIRQSGESP